MKWVALLSQGLSQRNPDNTVPVPGVCCHLLEFIVVAMKQHITRRCSESTEDSRHSAQKTSLLIRELTEEEEVDVICDSEQVF